ncbi:glycosyltransferase [Microbacterium sp. NPDC056057]|uniref:glycosyltransferase n=1 Tax=Microbacterium sp. NPDC056057 TaxID=3345699 RepID=UPI0035DE3A44
MSDTTVFSRQKLILRVMYWMLKPFALFARRIDWVVGPEDIALMATNIASALPRSYTAIHARNRFYDVPYDAVIQTTSTALGGRWATWRRLYGGPILLAWLANRARGFIYVGGGAFLEGHHDERDFEFTFLRRHRRRLVCYFTGNDIRSPKLMAELAARTGRPNLGTRLLEVDPLFATDAYDESRRLRADVADRHAEVIFNARNDQLSYLRSPTHPFLYFHPDEQFAPRSATFDDLSTIVIVHAPSSPVLKGTDAVRAAMARITAAHPHVEYRELIGVPHSEVLAALDEAHIALNEFYSSVPGVFGVEAMARRCVVVTSASADDEPDLGVESRGAWVVADVDSLHDAVAGLLEHPQALAAQADRGWEWARTHASASASRAAMRAALQAPAAVVREADRA